MAKNSPDTPTTVIRPGSPFAKVYRFAVERLRLHVDLLPGHRKGAPGRQDVPVPHREDALWVLVGLWELADWTGPHTVGRSGPPPSRKELAQHLDVSLSRLDRATALLRAIGALRCRTLYHANRVVGVEMQILSEPRRYRTNEPDDPGEPLPIEEIEWPGHAVTSVIRTGDNQASDCHRCESSFVTGANANPLYRGFAEKDIAGAEPPRKVALVSSPNPNAGRGDETRSSSSPPPARETGRDGTHDPSPQPPSPPARAAGRGRGAAWDALAEETGFVGAAGSAAGRLAKALKDIRAMSEGLSLDELATEIRVRAARYRRLNSYRITPTALAAQWPALAADPPPREAIGNSTIGDFTGIKSGRVAL